MLRGSDVLGPIGVLVRAVGMDVTDEGMFSELDMAVGRVSVDEMEPSGCGTDDGAVGKTISTSDF